MQSRSLTVRDDTFIGPLEEYGPERARQCHAWFGLIANRFRKLYAPGERGAAREFAAGQRLTIKAAFRHAMTDDPFDLAGWTPPQSPNRRAASADITAHFRATSISFGKLRAVEAGDCAGPTPKRATKTDLADLGREGGEAAVREAFDDEPDEPCLPIGMKKPPKTDLADIGLQGGESAVREAIDNEPTLDFSGTATKKPHPISFEFWGADEQARWIAANEKPKPRGRSFWRDCRVGPPRIMGSATA